MDRDIYEMLIDDFHSGRKEGKSDETIKKDWIGTYGITPEEAEEKFKVLSERWSDFESKTKDSDLSDYEPSTGIGVLFRD